jgi:hypothetical protein
MADKYSEDGSQKSEWRSISLVGIQSALFRKRQKHESIGAAEQLLTPDSSSIHLFTQSKNSCNFSSV